jgi:hypothetical protein
MTGALRVVSTAGSCLVGETPVDWNVQGPQGVPDGRGPQGLQRGHGASGLQLVDAVGTVVGEWTTGAAGAGFDSAVSWTEGSDRVAMLLTSRDMWTVAGTPTFLYESTDCSGAPLLPVLYDGSARTTIPSEDPSLFQWLIGGVDGVFWMRSGPAFIASTMSTRVNSQVGQPCYSYGGGVAFTLVRAAVTLDLSQRFVLPFHVE